MNKSKGLTPLVLSVVAAASLTASANTLSATPRGRDVSPQASGCNIGHFPQTTKAGEYNELCNVMQDPEKCLALVKRQFRFDGTNVIVTPVSNLNEPRMGYCLDVLRNALLHPSTQESDLAE